MANVSRKGFYPAKSLGAGEPTIREYSTNATIAAGDAVILSQGYADIALLSSGSLLGVAASDAASNKVMVYDDPETIFVGQFGVTSYTTALRGKQCDIKGSTGAMEVVATTTETVVTILREEVSDDNAIGANTKVLFRITRHQLNGDQTA